MNEDRPASYFDRSRSIAAVLARGELSEDPLELAAYLRAVGTAGELDGKIERMIRFNAEFDELIRDPRRPTRGWGRIGIELEEVERANVALHSLYVRLCDLHGYAEQAEATLLRQGWCYNSEAGRLEAAEGSHRRKHFVTEAIERAYDRLRPGHEPNPEAPHSEWRTAENTQELRDRIAKLLYLFPEPLVDPRAAGPVAKAVDRYWDRRWNDAIQKKRRSSAEHDP